MARASGACHVAEITRTHGGRRYRYYRPSATGSWSLRCQYLLVTMMLGKNLGGKTRWVKSTWATGGEAVHDGR